MSPDLDLGRTEGTAPESARFPVQRCLGVRPKAETYLCRDPQNNGRTVVRKILSTDFSAENPDIIDLVFPRWASLDHPHIARVLDYGWEEGKAFLNTEFVEGVPLLQALQGESLETTWLLFGQLLLALEHLVAHNVFHLDLKPQNVLVAKDAAGGVQLKLVDFGWMPLFFPTDPLDTNAVGLPPYTAPEYALRRVPDPRGDLYSVGVLLYAALARRLPFNTQDPVALLQAQLQRDPPPLKSVVSGTPAPLSDYVQRLMARDPQGRFESPGRALRALQEALGAGFPDAKLAGLAPFSDPEALFQREEYLKLFRRIAIQGGRWAIQGEPGSGKTFLARWLERLFWLNQKRTLFISGNNLSLIQGESSLNPNAPTFLFIDDADRAPVEGWLRGRPYLHVVALGRKLDWAKQDKGWNSYRLPTLPQDQLVAALTAEFGKPDPRVAGWFQARSRALPRGVVQGARALHRQGMLRREGPKWVLNSEKMLRAAAGSADANLLGALLPSLGKEIRPLLSRMALVCVPLRASTLAATTGTPAESVPASLEYLVREGLAERRLKGGEEYFEAVELPDAALESGLGREDRFAWFRMLEAEGWYAAAAEAVPAAFADAAQDPAVVLLQAELFGAAGAHDEVLRRLTAAFVKALPPEQKSAAFESFGTAMLATGKDKQAEAAFRNAFQQYKAAQDASGQARVWLQMGLLAQRGGDLGRALQSFQQALSLAAKSRQPEVLRGRIACKVAQLYAGATDFENAEMYFQQALGAVEAARHGAALAEVYAAYAELCFQRNDAERAEIFCREALAWALFQRLPILQGKAFSLLARIDQQKENARGADGRLSEAVEVLEKSGDVAGYLNALLERAAFCETHREWTAAERDARQALDLARRIPSPEWEGAALFALGKIQSLDLGRLPTAQENLLAARALLSKVGDAERGWRCELQLGEIDRIRGNFDIARRYYQQALQQIDQRLTRLAPDTYEATQLAERRREVEMSMRVLS